MTDRMPRSGPPVTDDELVAVAEGRSFDPHAVLGQHGFEVAGSPGSHTVIRTRRPLADRVEALLDGGGALELEHIGHGIWAGAGEFGPVDYRIGIADIAIASAFVNMRHAGVAPERKRWPKLRAFLERMHGRPSFKKLVDEETPIFGKRSERITD